MNDKTDKIYKHTVSVIIPIYKNSPFEIQRCIESVLMQRGISKQIIIVIDEIHAGQYDSIVKYSDSYKIDGYFDDILHIESDNSLKFIAGTTEIIFIENEHKTNQPSALNQGIKKSNGEYIALLDCDDYYLTASRLIRHIHFMKEQNIQYSYTDVLLSDSKGALKMHKKSHQLTDDTIEYFIRKPFIVPSSVIFHRNVIWETGFFNSQLDFCEDFEFILRMFTFCRSKIKIGYFPEITTVHTIQDNQKTQNPKSEEMKMLMIKRFWFDIPDNTETIEKFTRYFIRWLEKYLIKDHKYYTGEPLREFWKERDRFNEVFNDDWEIY